MPALAANLLLFQLGWLASVVGAGRGLPWLGVVVVPVILVVHLRFIGTSRETVLIILCAAVGTALDTVLLHGGVVRYASAGVVAPVWITAMWANFAITLRHAFSWLASRPFWAAIAGAASGPTAYWAAARLGAVELPSPLLAYAVLAAAWALAVPALLHVAARLVGTSAARRASH